MCLTVLQYVYVQQLSQDEDGRCSAAAVDGQMWCSLGRNGIISTTQCMMKEHICRFTVAQKGTLMQLSYSGSPLTVVVGGVVPLQELCCSSRQQDDEAAPWYI